MMRLILNFHEEALKISDKVSTESIAALPVREKIGRFKYTEEKNIDIEYEAISTQTKKELEMLGSGGES